MAVIQTPVHVGLHTRIFNFKFSWITAITALEWSKIIKILVSIKKMYLLSRTENWLFVTDGKNFVLKFWDSFELK